MLPELIDTLLDAYRYAARRPARTCRSRRGSRLWTWRTPRRCRSSGSSARRRAQAGLEALHASLDELSYDGSLLRAQGEPVHLVYRRVLLEDVRGPGATT